MTTSAAGERPDRAPDSHLDISIDDLGRIMDRLGEGAILVNLTTRLVLEANDEFFRLSGFGAADIGTLDLLRLHGLEDLERILACARRPDGSGTVLPAVSCSRKDGSLFPADLRVMSLSEGEGALVLLTYREPCPTADDPSGAARAGERPALTTFTRELAGVRERDVLGRVVNEASRALMATPRVLLLAQRGVNQGAEVLASSGCPAPLVQAIRDWLGSSIDSGLLSANRPRLIGDTGREEGLGAAREWLEGAGIRAMVVFPLEGEDRVLGAWVLGYGDERSARACDLELGQSFAAHLSGTVAGVLLLERTLREKGHHEVLNRIVSWLRGPLDMEGILRSLSVELCRTLGADRCVIFTAEEGDGDPGAVLRVEVEHRADGLAPLKPRGSIPFSSTALGTAVLFSREPLNVPDFGLRPDLSEDPASPAAAPFGLRSFIMAKIVSRQEFIGLVAVGLSSGVRQWSAEEVDLVRAVADHAAVTMETGRLARASKERADQIERERREWERTFDAIPDMVSIHDGYGRLLRANLAMQDRLGGDPRAYVGRECGDILETVMGRSSGCPHEEATRARRAIAREVQGERGVFALTAIPCFDAAGQCLYIIHVCKEITEEKQIREQLLQTEKMAAVGNLVSGVAHELNNPLAGVIGFSEILLEKDLDARVRKSVARIRDEAERASRIVRNLLTFARKHKPESVMTDLNAVLGKTIELRAYDLRVKKIKVSTRLTPDLPRTLADPNQLLQVFMNIITNAEQAMVEAHGKGGLEIGTSTAKDHIRVTIRDDGPGIHPDTLKKIFDPFFTTKPIGKGTGLGLSICHGIIKEHNGKISVASAVGEGTTFTIELPLVSGPEAREEARRAAVERAPAATILVVDDEPSIRDMIEDALAGRGHTVVTVDGGQAALEALAARPYDLIVSDLKMPEMDGQELYERLREGYPRLAENIIFTSGDTVSAETRAFFEKTGRAYLLKPFRVQDLILEVEKHLPRGGRPRGAASG
ncbi:MAG: ATP-binding protein [Acidobacteriota bacterium]